MNIDWEHPEPREGWRGSFDKFIGPGATPVEIKLQIYPPLVFLVIAPAYAFFKGLDWSFLQYVVCAILAGDMLGGIITNATSAAKRWYHREGETDTAHLKFTAIHLVHLFIVSWLYLNFNIGWFIGTSAYLMISAWCILKIDGYLQRPLAMMLYCLAIILSLYIFKSPEGMEWFLPLFYLKLLVCHLIKEEPYRP